MIKDFGLVAIIIFLNHWVYGVEDLYSYQYLTDFLTKHQTIFLAGGTLGSIWLVLSSYLFENFGLYKISYGLSKIFVRISHFFIMFIVSLNMFFYLTIDANLMRDKGYYILFILFIVLGASCTSLRIIDFNYHTKNAIVPITVVTAMSILLVEFIWPVFM